MAQAANQLSFKGDIAFIKELGTFLSEKYVSLVLLNVACDSFKDKISQKLHLYIRNEYCPDFKLSFYTIVKRHTGIFPLYEFRNRSFIPVRSQIEIDSYVEALLIGNLPSTVINDKLRDSLWSFLCETEKTLLRSFYEYFDFTLSRSESDFVMLNEINDAVDAELINQVFGHRGNAKFISNHPEIFVFKKIKNESYISLKPNVDINKYICTVRFPKLKLCREEKNWALAVGDVKSAALSKYEREAILFVSEHIDSFSGTDRILTVKDYVRKMVPNMPMHISSELKFLYGNHPYRKFITKHKTVFQPLNKQTGHKIESFRLADNEIIHEYIRSSTDKLSGDNLDFIKRKRMKDVEKAIRIESESLNFVRSLIVAETDITVAKLRKEVVKGDKTKNSIKNRLSKAKIDDFFFKHARVFPMVVGKDSKMVFETVSDAIFQEYLIQVQKSITDKMVGEIELQAMGDKSIKESQEDPDPICSYNYQSDSDDEWLHLLMDKTLSIS